MRRFLAVCLLALFTSCAVAQPIQPPVAQPIKQQALNVAVAQAGNTTLLSVFTAYTSRLFVACTVADQDLDAFVISAQPYLAPAMVTFYSASGDYTSPAGLLLGTSTDLTTLAAKSTGWFIMDTTGIDEVQVAASSGNVAGSTVSCYAGGF